MLLDGIKSPSDLQKLKLEELPELAEEIRFEILKTVFQNGGHLASSLGVVELTIALHYCFDLSKDKLIFDVGHQCYPHKILTNRRQAFKTIRKLGGLSGFPYPRESSYDTFHTGHAGTSISLGLGASWGNMLQNNNPKDERQRAICVIGDASLGAGVALEALNWAGQKDCDMLIVLNDNEMSITRTVGALARYLSSIRIGPIYTGVKKELQTMVAKLPFIGEKMDKGIGDLLKTIKNTLVPGQLFEEFGCTYYGPVKGHDLSGLIDTFDELKNFKGLCILHLLTEKGKGYAYAVKDPESFHGVSPGAAKMNVGKDGKIRIMPNHVSPPKVESYTKAFGRKLIDVAERDERVVAITAAMPEGTGLKEFSKKYPNRFFDTGITEQHAVAFAGGLAYTGVKPVVAIYSTFMQRCYDQIFQEVCLQNSNVLLAMDRGGLVGQDGPTHHGLFDIAFLRTLPRMTLMSPKDKPEFEAMIDFAINWDGPIGLRYPRAAAFDRSLPENPIEYGKGELLVEGEDVLIVAYGPLALDCLDSIKLLSKRGIHPSLINARFAKPLDTDLIAKQMAGKRLVVTVEEHALSGGFGSAISEYLCESNYKGDLLRLGVDDQFIEHGARSELLEMLRLTPSAMADRILEYLNEKDKTHTHSREWQKTKDQEIL